MIFSGLFPAELPLMDLVAEELNTYCELHGLKFDKITREEFEGGLIEAVIAEGGEATQVAKAFGVIPYGRPN